MAKNHDVDFQMNQIKNILKEDKGISIPENIILKAAEISMYATEARYPNELPIDEKDVSKALQDSKEIMDWVKNVIDEK